jgi:carboxymethylenebutenolidase
MAQFLSLTVPGGALGAYIARPAHKGPTPALLLLPEIFGVTAGMRDLCEDFGRLGYCAICPDILWRVGSGAEYSDGTAADREQARRASASFDVAQGLDDVVAIVAQLRTAFGLDGRVALVGYGLGGLMAFVSAAVCHPDAAAAYYPAGIETYLDPSTVVATPLLLQLGAEDEQIPRATQQAIVSMMDRFTQAEVEIHPGVGHGFARRDSDLFDAVASGHASRYTADFLRAFLTDTRAGR